MIRKWTVLIVLVALSTSMAFADEVVSSEVGITVSEAVERMKDNSIQLKLDALEIRARGIALEEAKIAAEGPNYAYDAASEYDKLLKEVLNPLLAEAAYKQAVAIMAEREASYVDTIENLFRAIAKGESEGRYLENVLAFETASYERGKIDLSRGLISKIDLAMLSYDLSKAKLDFDEAALDLKADYDALMALIGWDEVTEGNLKINYTHTSNLEPQSDGLENLDLWISQDAETAYLKVKLEAAKIVFDAADRLFLTYEREWLDAQEALLIGQKNYDEAVDALIVMKKNAINTYKMDQALYELSVFYAELMNEKVAQSELLLNLGQISLETHLQTKLAAEKAQIW